MRTVLKYIVRIVGYTVTTILLLIVLFAFFSQTEYFKDKLRPIVIAQLGKQFNGTIHIGKISGNFLNDIQIDSLSLFYGNTPVFSSAKISVSYQPITFFKSVIVIDSLKLENPRVSFTRLNDGNWNIGMLLKPSTDTSTGTFDKTIVLKSFSMLRGTVSLHDSTMYHDCDTTHYGFHRLDYHNFDVTNLDMFLTATIKDQDISTKITSIRFISVAPRFVMQNFRGEFYANPKEVAAKNVTIQTENSRLNLQAVLRQHNIFTGLRLPELKHKVTFVTLNADVIDFAELKQFLPELYFLNGKTTLDLDVAGQFGALNVRHLNLDTYSTSFRIGGAVKNLDHPDSLHITAYISPDSKLDPADANKLMPSFGLPEFDKIGVTSLSAQFIGYPSNFRPGITMKGSFGSLDISGSMNIPDGTPRYNLKFETKGLNLARILNDTALTSYITTKGELVGEGTTLSDLQSQLNVDIDTVHIQTFAIDHSKATVNATPHTLESISFLNMNGATVNINGKLSNVGLERPELATQLAVTSLDINKFFPGANFESRINATANIEASGKSIDDLNLSSSIILSQSKLQSYSTSEEKITINLDQHTPQKKHFAVESSVANVTIDGTFDVDLLSKMIPQTISTFVDRILEHTSTTATGNLQGRSPISPDMKHTRTDSTMNFWYSVDVFDLDPVSKIIGKTPFNATAALTGSMSSTGERLSLITNGNVSEFSLGENAKDVLLREANLSIDVKDLSSRSSLETASINMDVNLGYGSIDGTNLDSSGLVLRYDDNKGKFHCYGTIDSLTKLHLNGSVSMQPETYVFDLDDLSVALRNYEWKNDNDVQIRLNKEGVRVLHALLRHETESIYLVGELNSIGTFDMNSTIRNLDISRLSRWLLNSSNQTPNTGLQGILNTEIHLSGTTDSPIIALKTKSDNIRFRKTQIGDVLATFDYEKNIATIVANVSTPGKDTIPTLTVTGFLPINLAFKNVGKRLLDKEQNFHVVSHGFSLGILEQVVPQMKNLTGTFEGDILMRGTPERPMYSGNLTFANTRFTFSPNNLRYELAGSIVPKAEQLIFKDIVIKNLTDSRYAGSAIANGYITLKSFALTDFNVNTVGSILLMSDSTRKVVTTMYGPLLAETDSAGVRMKGTTDRPYLSGNLFVADANLVFPPTKESNNDASAYTLNYVVVNDTIKQNYTGRDSSRLNTDASSAYYAMADSDSKKEEYRQGFLDLLRYDLHIEARGPTRTKMIFTPATKEELYTELEGSVRAVNEKGVANVYGEISMTERSYYGFLSKKFDATGTLRFFGPWDNPELYVKAIYSSYHTSTDAQATSSETSQLQQQKVLVQIDITGTRYEPRPSLSMKIQDPITLEEYDWSTQAKGGDVQSDAISFILSGKFKDELTSSDRSSILSTSTGALVTSSFFSGMVSDYLKTEFPFIRNAEVTYGGGDIQKTNLRLSFELLNSYITFGGQIFSGLGNANVNYQVSLGNAFQVPSIRNLFFELERKVEGSEFSDQQLNPATNTARLYYRISF